MKRLSALKTMLLTAAATAMVAVPVASAQDDGDGGSRRDRGGFRGGPGGGGPGGGGPGGGGRFGGGMRGGPGGQGGGGMRGGQAGGMDPTLMLLMSAEVREEIGLDAEQGAALKKLSESLRPERPDADFRSMSNEERTEFFESMRTKMQEKAKEAKEQLQDVLFPGQMKRLNELAIQRMGLAALNNPEVAEKLKITDEQKAEMEAARSSVRDKMREMFAGRSDGERPDREKMMEAFKTAQKDTEAKMMDVLTAEQKSQLDEMKGEPFEFKDQGFRGGDRGGDRGGRFGRGGDRGGDRPEGDRRSGRRPGGDRPGGDRPGGDRADGDRPGGDRPGGREGRRGRPGGRGDSPNGGDDN